MDELYPFIEWGAKKTKAHACTVHLAPSSRWHKNIGSRVVYSMDGVPHRGVHLCRFLFTELFLMHCFLKQVFYIYLKRKLT